MNMRILKRLLMIALAFVMIVLAGCVGFVPQVSPPTPTTISGNLLPVESIYSNYICTRLENEYQLFFTTSREAWNDAWLPLVAIHSMDVEVNAITEAIESTDFQRHALLLAIRTCHSSGGYDIAVRRVVEVSADELYVYVSLRDPSLERGGEAVEAGRYQIVRIPWAHDDTPPPTVRVIAYTQLLGIDE